MASPQQKAQANFQDLLPTLADKVGGDGLIGKLCNGFNLLTDPVKGVITFENLKRNSTLLGLQNLSDNDLLSKLQEGAFDSHWIRVLGFASWDWCSGHWIRGFTSFTTPISSYFLVLCVILVLMGPMKSFGFLLKNPIVKDLLLLLIYGVGKNWFWIEELKWMYMC